MRSALAGVERQSRTQCRHSGARSVERAAHPVGATAHQSGSNRTRRLPPMRLSPQPPALDDSRNTNWRSAGSLNSLTSFWRLLMVVLPSSLSTGYCAGARASYAWQTPHMPRLPCPHSRPCAYARTKHLAGSMRWAPAGRWGADGRMPKLAWTQFTCSPHRCRSLGCSACVHPIA